MLRDKKKNKPDWTSQNGGSFSGFGNISMCINIQNIMYSSSLTYWNFDNYLWYRRNICKQSWLIFFTVWKKIWRNWLSREEVLLIKVKLFHDSLPQFHTKEATECFWIFASPSKKKTQTIKQHLKDILVKRLTINRHFSTDGF